MAHDPAPEARTQLWHARLTGGHEAFMLCYSVDAWRRRAEEEEEKEKQQQTRGGAARQTQRGRGEDFD